MIFSSDQILTVMHTIFVREHNRSLLLIIIFIILELIPNVDIDCMILNDVGRLAGQLGKINPHWDDETIFQVYCSTSSQIRMITIPRRRVISMRPKSSTSPSMSSYPWFSAERLQNDQKQTTPIKSQCEILFSVKPADFSDVD